MSKLIFTQIILILVVMSSFGQYQSTTVQTPRGITVNALRFTGTDFDEDDIEYWNNSATNTYNCRILANSTNYYNCHGYAWYNIEGHMSQSEQRWLNDVDANGDPIYNVTKYYSGSNPSYTQVYTYTNHLKVSYFPKDHSAISTDSDSLISKWGWGPLVKHLPAQCPWYSGSQIKYYKLDFGFSGSTSLICAGQQRTFTSNSIIPGSTYSWTKDNNRLNYVSGSGTYQYIIQAKSNVNDTAWVDLQMTTPSGEIANAPAKKFWVGVPEIKNKKVDGSNYYSGMQICPGNHYLSLTPFGDGAGSATWTVPYGIQYYVGTNTLDFTFPYGRGSLSITARSSNSCGASSNSAFYLVERTYGCLLGGMTISPNPASQNLTITIEENPIKKDSILQQEDINKINTSDLTVYTIRIYNNQSMLVQMTSRTGRTFSIPVNNLNNGNYVIEVSDQINVYRNQLLIKHD